MVLFKTKTFILFERMFLLALLLFLFGFQVTIFLSEIGRITYSPLANIYFEIIDTFDTAPSLTYFRLLKVLLSLVMIIISLVLLKYWERRERFEKKNKWLAVQGIIFTLHFILSLLIFLKTFSTREIMIEISDPEIGGSVTSAEAKVILDGFQRQFNENPQIKDFKYDVKNKNMNNFTNTATSSDILIVPKITKSTEESDSVKWVQKVYPKDPSLLIKNKKAWADSAFVLPGTPLPKFLFDKPELLIKFLTAYDLSSKGDYYSSSIIFKNLIEILEKRLKNQEFFSLSEYELKNTISELYYWLARSAYRRYIIRKSELASVEEAILCLNKAISLYPGDLRYHAYLILLLKIKIDPIDIEDLSNQDYKNMTEQDTYEKFLDQFRDIKKHYDIVRNSENIPEDILFILRELRVFIEKYNYLVTVV